MQLFRVDISQKATTSVFVIAEDREAAREYVEQNTDDCAETEISNDIGLAGDIEVGEVVLVKSIEEVPKDFRDSIAWGENIEDEITLDEFLSNTTIITEEN